jgi:PKD repeat protein
VAEAGATDVTTAIDPATAARALVGAPATGDIVGNGVEVLSAAFVKADGTAGASANATGLFSGAPAGFGFSSGVALASGDANILQTASDPGYQAVWSADSANSPPPADWFAANGNAFPKPPGDPQPIGGLAHDSTMLQMTLRPSGTTLQLDWLFGSEEYGAVGGVDPTYNDFGLILVDTQATGNASDKDCARLAPDNRPTSVALIDTSAAYFRTDSGGALSSLYGLITPQTCHVNVVPGETVTLRATVFDLSDDGNDAALVLGADSLRSDLPPTAAIGIVPGSGPAPLDVTLSFSGTADDTAVASWQLDFGDGQNTSGTGGPPAQLQHRYENAGNYTATLTVTDDSGQQGSASSLVNVTAPTSAAGTPPGAGTNQPTTTPTTKAAPRLVVPRKLLLARLLRGVPVKLTCNAPCSERVLLLVDRPTAKRLGLRGKRHGKRVIVGSARAARAQAGTGTVTAKLTRANARHVRSLRPRTFKLAIGLERAGAPLHTITVKR